MEIWSHFAEQIHAYELSFELDWDGRWRTGWLGHLTYIKDVIYYLLYICVGSSFWWIINAFGITTRMHWALQNESSHAQHRPQTHKQIFGRDVLLSPYYESSLPISKIFEHLLCSTQSYKACRDWIIFAEFDWSIFCKKPLFKRHSQKIHPKILCKLYSVGLNSIHDFHMSVSQEHVLDTCTEIWSYICSRVLLSMFSAKCFLEGFTLPL